MSYGPHPTSTPRHLARRSIFAVATVTVLALGAAMPAGATTPVDVDAKTKLTKVSHDPYTNPNAYHQTELEPDTYAWGDTIVGVFQTGRFSDGGSSNTGYATSTDGGATWTHGFMPKTTVYADPVGPYARISDPSIAYDAKHDVWIANSLIVDVKNVLIVNRSVDGGVTFKKPVIVSTPTGSSDYDKNWIACDNWATSPHYGNCYVEVDDFTAGDLVLMFTSTDGGKTWTKSDVAAAHGLGGQPVAQPDGTVIVPFSGDFANVQSLVSTDGGDTYKGPFAVSSTTDHSVPFMRAPPLPSAEVDGNGKVYVVWQDCRFRTGCSTNDIVMSTSKNGKDWSEVVRIPIDPVSSTVDHFTPGLGVDADTAGGSAHLALTYYYFPTDSCTFETCKLFAGFVSSIDGGAHWSDVKKVLGPLSLAWLPSAGGRFVGDYISTSFMGGRAWPVIANATEGTCTLGQVDSCREFMVAPKNGLAVTGGVIPIGPEQPVTDARSDHAQPEHPRAF
jgi:hypothetical protein